MAVITIDGIKLDVPENKNVLDCALENGIYIPHLCHHKDLSPLGSLSYVCGKVEGQEGVTTSCTLKAKDGMVIKTKTAELDASENAGSGAASDRTSGRLFYMSEVRKL